MISQFAPVPEDGTAGQTGHALLHPIILRNVFSGGAGGGAGDGAAHNEKERKCRRCVNISCIVFFATAAFVAVAAFAVVA
jgi:hypothetical protein